MVIYDELGNVVENTDPSVGEVVHVTRPKAGAEKVGGIWPDGSFESVGLYRLLSEAELSARSRRLRKDGIVEEFDQYAADTDTALFDLDAAQSTYETDTDTALFDLAEYVASLEARIAALEA